MRTASQVFPVNILEGEQFKHGFLKIAPDNRIPVIVDHSPADGGEPVSIFESGALLIHLGERPARSCRRTARRATRSCSG